MTLRALLIAVAAGLLLAAGPSPGQPPAEGKTEGAKGPFRLIKPLTLPHEGQVFSVAFSPDARLLASSTIGGRVRLWDARTGKLLWWRQVVESAPVYRVAFSPDGKVLACPELYAAVHLLDAATGKERAVLRHDERGAVGSAAFSPDGRWLVSGGGGGLVVWDLRTHKKHRELLGPLESVGLIALSPDGNTVAAAWTDDLGLHPDLTVRLWDTRTGKELRRFQDKDGLLTSLAFSPSGKVLACGYWKETRRGEGPPVFVVRLRDVATGRTTIKTDDRADSLAFSPDGHLLLVSRGGHYACRLREAATGKEVHTLVRRWNDVHRVAFSPDGRAVALGTTDHKVLVQRLAPDLPGEGGKPVEADALARLWTDLGGEDPSKRYQAIWTLAAKPAQAVPFLKGRVERALPDIDRAVGEGTVRVLELIDTPEARQLLRKLAAEARASSLKQGATAALGRLEARARGSRR